MTLNIPHEPMGVELIVPTDVTTAELGLALRWMEAVLDERRFAHHKHRHTSMEQSDVLSHRRASILTEEAVECARALNDNEHGAITLEELTHDMRPRCDVLDKELIQTGAMAFTWWANRRRNRLPAIPEPTKVPPDMVLLLGELADPNSGLQNALGDDDVKDRARKLLDWLGVE